MTATGFEYKKSETPFETFLRYTDEKEKSATKLATILEKKPSKTTKILDISTGNGEYLGLALSTVGAKRRVQELNADKGYDSAAFRRHLRKRGIGTNIPERKFKKRRKLGWRPHLNKAHLKLRAFTERTNAWLKYFRKLRYRWERKKCMFQAVVDLACLLICLRRVEI